MRSGKEVESSRQKEEKRKENEVEREVEIDPEKAEVAPTRCSEGPKSRGISFPNNALIILPPLPFPQMFQKKKHDTQFSKFLKIFKKIHINIPFADALEQMLNYAKFMKEVMAKKRKLEDYETVKLTEECNAILQRKLP